MAEKRNVFNTTSLIFPDIPALSDRRSLRGESMDVDTHAHKHTHTHTLDVACFASSRLHVLALKTLTLFLIMLLEIFQLMKIILHEKDHCGRVLQHTEDKIADRKCPSRSRNEQNECCK